MSTACPGLTYGDAFVTGVLNAVDCQARAIASLGYQALAAPGSDIALVVTGLLTLFVALFGYRLMMGETLRVSDGVLAVAKIGLVLALATSWATYRTLAHDVVFDAPAELVGEVSAAAGLPGATGEMTARLQLTDQGFVQLGELGVGPRPTGDRVARIRNINGRNETVIEDAQQPVGIVEPLALGGARVVFLVGATGALMMVRLVAAILLALGPLFVTFLLFDATRGWFAGWLRGLSATMLGAFGIAIVLSVELAVIEPWLASLVARRLAEDSIVGAPVALLATTLGFGLAILGVLAAAARVAGAFRIPDAWRALPERLSGAFSTQLPIHHAADTAAIPAADRPRAAAVADAVVTTQRREATMAAATAGYVGRPGASAPPRMVTAAALSRDLPATSAPPLGQSLGRRTRNRVSASAGRRDSRQ